MVEVKNGNEETRGRSWSLGQYVEAGIFKIVMKLKVKGKGSSNRIGLQVQVRMVW
jgi:hypothetical protein